MMAWREIVISVYYTYWNGYFPEDKIIESIIKNSNLSPNDSLREAVIKIEKEIDIRNVI